MASKAKRHQESRMFICKLVVFRSLVHDPCAVNLRQCIEELRHPFCFEATLVIFMILISY